MSATSQVLGVMAPLGSLVCPHTSGPVPLCTVASVDCRLRGPLPPWTVAPMDSGLHGPSHPRTVASVD